MSNGRVQLHVDETKQDIGKRVIEAWRRMEHGEDVNDKHVSFENWETMVRVLSPKRLELLRHIHQHPAKNVRVLAFALGRDYRRVHDDVEALEAAGLLERGKDGVRADYDAFDVRMRVAL